MKGVESEGAVHPDLLLSSYEFVLPEACIAQRPVEPRHAARLLAVDADSACRHLTVWDLQNELLPGDLLVVNDTRVLKARLAARRASGGAVEVLLLDPLGDGCWRALARPARRLKPGEWLQLEAPDQPALAVEVVALEREAGTLVIRFPADRDTAAAIEGLLDRYGEMPLPPYIHQHEPSDDERYQTRFADRPGAVAAPTAGLHFSDALLAALAERGVTIARITLHVGLGTFRPVEREDLSGLELHSEWVELNATAVEAVAACRRRGGRVIAIGTTSVRSLEGVAALHDGQLVPYRGPVNLVIQPGFRFQVVQGLLTNFHLPRSSLLLLVSALVGRERLLELYGTAIKAGYRFFSYGDAMWIPPAAVLESARPTAAEPSTQAPPQSITG
ncbi:tRNA preQ1(34) S-adenosylmethionine ribosyltransferase-isomerase QueA [Synechococcus sp. CS-1325]|uniref:tRNA preQ1(34) S-adenosylmethionine ribosyltransferase-isomerase QueA n=1 Tax=unclassified Synechococcus TaxID=2626047 RepID=UPI000DB8ED50|nr:MULTISPECIES: tRNA preQ1(34) S-adenosylmethionine ribosyltransferase-isomerase QueA [unclassified Synechococcus]MCT0200659.1 tRNA preQ1(34) S-adenosylmethionine ribosyltransferase-isomerase QueA [Synechococcus sp. CS-1325]MCT0212234.1 tRNA preQ1(34) S-adenosylmethionine ribosyltransferase-isomerase QueA [Synechococcus sp. CS-1326]MCT0234353.1 tRNA preQ1(34) S-adenosylmethionine ribosyltransferase-isomerase QueA [Synechococcus sp. CS-1327]PZU96255.1 MAG: tRNA preQ1(34) S-adenosylmethionine ri